MILLLLLFFKKKFMLFFVLFLFLDMFKKALTGSEEDGEEGKGREEKEGRREKALLLISPLIFIW